MHLLQSLVDRIFNELLWQHTGTNCAVWKDSGWPLRHHKGLLESIHLRRTAVKRHASFLLLCFSEIKMKLELVKRLRQSEWGSSVGRGVRSRTELQMQLVWLPHLAAEWQAVRCGHSRLKVCGTDSDESLCLKPALPSLPLKFNCLAKTTLLQYRLSKWISTPSLAVQSQTTELFKKSWVFQFQVGLHTHPHKSPHTHFCTNG